MADKDTVVDFSGIGSFLDPTGADLQIQEVDEVPTEKTEEPKSELEKLQEEPKEKADLGVKEVEEVPEVEEEIEDSIEEEEEEPEEPGVFSILASDLHEKGIIDGFSAEEFDDSEEAFESLISKTVENKVKAYKDSLSPVAQKFIDFVEKGGNPNEFIDAYSDIDYSQIPEDALAENDDAQKELVFNYLKSDGWSNEDIREAIEDYEESGILAKEAKRALKKMRIVQAAEREALVERQEQLQEQRRKQAEESFKKLEEDINAKENIAGIPIKERDKKKFFDYITKPIDKKTGATQFQIDFVQDPEAQVKMAYFMYNKFDFSKIENTAKKKVTSDLKEKLTRASESASTQKGKHRTKTARDKDGVDYNVIKNIL